MLSIAAQLLQFMTLAHYLLLPFVTTDCSLLVSQTQLDVRVVFITVTQSTSNQLSRFSTKSFDFQDS